MEDSPERSIAGFTVRIDRLLCVGFGDCIEEAPEAFVFDDDGIVTFTADPSELTPDRLIAACRACPVDALTVLGPAGEILAP